MRLRSRFHCKFMIVLTLKVAAKSAQTCTADDNDTLRLCRPQSVHLAAETSTLCNRVRPDRSSCMSSHSPAPDTSADFGLSRLHLFDIFARFATYWICAAARFYKLALRTTSLAAFNRIVETFVEKVWIVLAAIFTASMRLCDAIELLLKRTIGSGALAAVCRRACRTPNDDMKPVGAVCPKRVRKWHVPFIVNCDTKADCLRCWQILGNVCIKKNS